MMLLNQLFPVGRRSLLWGVHQFLWHPWTVYKAWKYLYGRPTWKEIICIVIHDWGYWFTPNMDGEEGEKHPEFGAKIAGKLFGEEYYYLVLYHSRHYAKLHEAIPSRLCWADKLSVIYDPRDFYLFRAKLSGEIKEYRLRCKENVPLSASNVEWFEWLKGIMKKLALTKKADIAPYQANWMSDSK